MDLKEIHILDRTLAELLTEAEKSMLQRKFLSEIEYNRYLIALLEALISKKTKTTLKELLSVVGISRIQNDLQQKNIEIIEELAELHFKGYNSDYTKWLQDSENETFITHLAFLKETMAGISQTERETLKSKLGNIDKLDAFEFEEKDVRLGIKLVERARLKKHFNELYSELRPKLASAPKKRKFALVFTIVIVSSIVFAIVNPSVRHFIKEQYHKLFDKSHESEGHQESKWRSAQALPSDTLLNNNSTDTLQEKPMKDTPVSKEYMNNKQKAEKIKIKKSSNKKDSVVAETIGISEFDNAEYGQNLEKVYEGYFKSNKKKLDPIEGFWLLLVKDKSNTANKFKVKSAIVRLTSNKFELIQLDNEGDIEKLPYSMSFELISPLEGYNFTIQDDKRVILKSKATIQIKEGIINFDSEYDARHFNPKNKKEMVKCKVSGFRK